MIHRVAAMLSIGRRTLCALIAAVILLGPAMQSQAKEIVDMFGRKFTIADRPQKVYCASPPTTNLLYAIDPGILAGLNSPLRGREKKYMRKEMQSLPVLGGWFGQGNVPNMEMILRAKPEIIIVQNLTSSLNSRANSSVMRSIPAPVVSISLWSLSDYPEAILFLGRLLGREARTQALAAYVRQTLAEMRSFAQGIPEKEKVSVYYAEGVKGLNTECDTSTRSEVIKLAGGRNVHRCEARNSYGMEKVDLEQVMVYDPDVIIVFEEAFYRSVFSDPLWQKIRAVKNKRVYLIPNQPFGWTDRPPSFMRFLGVKWLAGILHPDRYRVDIVQETQRFFQLFFGVRLGADEAKKVLRLPGNTVR